MLPGMIPLRPLALLTRRVAGQLIEQRWQLIE
jgi:hypothetical protein